MQARVNIKKTALSESRGIEKGAALLLILLFIMMLIGSKEAAIYIKKTLSSCFYSVIPSVFPLMVMSNMMVRGGGGELVSRIAGGAISRVFGVSRHSAVAVILGFVCGFPIGAVAATGLYERGSIGKGELCHLLTFVNNPGAAFVIFALGGGMLGSVRMGLIIYFSVLLSAAVAGVIARHIMDGETFPESGNVAVSLPFSELIVSSVSSSVTGILNVCACAAFFSAFVGAVSHLLARLGAPFQLGAALFGIFELIGGVSILTESSSSLFAALSSAAICSWSGISVLMQIISVCRRSLGNERISFTPMILSKCFQATLSPILVFLFIKLTRFDI